MQTSKTIGDFLKDLPRPAVLCTLVRVTGSAPQETGARMWVTAGRFYGTLGGGELERLILEHARGLLRSAGARPGLREFTLCKETGQCCGGRVEVFFEPVPARKAAHLFGGGHVGRALAGVLSGAGFDLHLIDPRPEWAAREELPADVEIHLADPVEYARSRDWTPEDAACVFTHSHDLDFRLIRHLLPRPPGYLGLIGSEHKARVFQARLRDAGDPDLERAFEERVRCPIGLPLPGKNPKVIAVAIAAELLQEWARKAAGVKV